MLLDIDLSHGVTLTFATPVLKRRVPALEACNPALERILLGAEAQREGNRASNAGGWQSPADLLTWPHAEIETLRREILETVTIMCSIPAEGDARRLRGQPRVAAWANVNRDGHYNRMHIHPGHHWSGVYYVTMGEPYAGFPDNGVIEFLDPRGAAAAAPIPGFPFGGKMRYDPRPGTMILFPSWLQHAVHPFRGAGARISIAFNVHIEGFAVD